MSETPLAISHQPSLAPRLDLGGYEGPMDLLLELAQRQRVDLGQLSILLLAQQFVEAVESAGLRVPLERQGDWLVMASALVLLRSRLLLPAGPEDAADAEQQAAARLGQVRELARMRAGAAWLEQRPQLGQQVFPRGVAEQRSRPRSEQLLGFLEAVLVMLEGRTGPAGEAPPTYRPAHVELWRVPEAMARLRRLLGEGGAGALAGFVPRIAPGTAARLRRRSALASTFLAALELAREGGLHLQQDRPFGTILLQPGLPGTALPA
jgi:segregation and condensation protein A